MKYKSGEEIRKGDKVLFFRNPATIELVANDETPDDWHTQEFRGGVMILDPMVSGRTFIPWDHLDEAYQLEFVSRAD